VSDDRVRTVRKTDEEAEVLCADGLRGDIYLSIEGQRKTRKVSYVLLPSLVVECDSSARHRLTSLLCNNPSPSVKS
jgi:hypothetical protein